LGGDKRIDRDVCRRLALASQESLRVSRSIRKWVEMKMMFSMQIMMNKLN